MQTGSKYTRTGEALGTPAYMSPEQARGETTTLTPAADVWAVGCIAYRLLAGRPPFEGETVAAAPGRSPPAPARLRRALELAPERDDWRLEWGLLLWAVGRGADARSAWSAIRRDAPEVTPGRLYRALEACFRYEARGLRSDLALPDLRVLADLPGREGRLARAALAAVQMRWAEARDMLRDEPGWEAALLRGHVNVEDPVGDKDAAIREFGRALDEGIRFAWVLNARGCARQSRRDLSGAIEDYRMALAVAPPDWPHRAAFEEYLARARAALASGG